MNGSIKSWIGVGVVSVASGLVGCDVFEYQGPLPNLRKVAQINFAELGKLESLHIRNNNLSREAAQELRLVNTVDSMIVEDCQLHDSRMLTESLAVLSRLKTLTIRRTNIVDEDVALLANIQQLEYLEVINTEVQGQGLAAFAKHPLKKLVFHSKTATAESLAGLAEFENLEELHLETPEVRMADLPSFAKLKKLRVLSLNQCNFSDVDDCNDRFLSDIPKLQTLVITSESLGTGTYRAMASIKSLENIELMDAPVSNEQILALEPLKHLKSLKCWTAERVTVTSVPSLLKHQELESLVLTNARIDRADARILDTIPNLIEVDVGFEEREARRGWRDESWEEDEEDFEIPEMVISNEAHNDDAPYTDSSSDEHDHYGIDSGDHLARRGSLYRQSQGY